MKPRLNARELLTSQGWKYTGNCRCSGMPTDKFELHTKAGVFKLRVRAMHYAISTPVTRFTKYPISDLIKTVNEIKENNEPVDRPQKTKVQSVRK